MGREVRRVPANWEHPTNENGEYQPMHDIHFADAMNDFMIIYDLGVNGPMNKFKQETCYDSLSEWLASGEASIDLAYYRSYDDDEATWYQMYETVTEGTPVSPAFETEQELINYLVEHGDFWQQRRRLENAGYSREAAEKFVKHGWAPSFIFSPKTGLQSGIEAMTNKKEDE